MNEEKICKYLRELPIRDDSKKIIEKIKQSLKSLKLKYALKNNQDGAKNIWCLEQILNIQNNYLSAFDDMKKNNFYNSWITFEQIEIALSNLYRHYKEKNSDFYLQQIYEYTVKFQTFFPYKIFLSTEEVITEKACSICGKKISLRNHCGHEVGEIYNGEMCLREIKKFEAILGVSIVYTPFRKYAVAFPKTDNNIDSYNYSALKFIIKHLESPFEKWDYKRTKKRHPHKFFPNLKDDDSCPCDSGKKYIDCCKSKKGILRPHYKIIFYKKKEENYGLEYIY